MPKPSNKIVFISTLFVSILIFAYNFGLGTFLPHKPHKPGSSCMSLLLIQRTTVVTNLREKMEDSVIEQWAPLMCQAVSWDTADGGVDLVKIIPRGQREEAKPPLVSLLFSTSICFHLHSQAFTFSSVSGTMYLTLYLY